MSDVWAAIDERQPCGDLNVTAVCGGKPLPLILIPLSPESRPYNRTAILYQDCMVL